MTMMPAEEVLRNVTYIRCGSCHGARVHPQGLGLRLCDRCTGWGYVVDPADVNERIRLGLKALEEDTVVEVSLTKRKKAPKRRLRIRFKPPRLRRP